MLATSLPRLDGLGAFALGAEVPLDSELAGVLSAEGMRKFLRLAKPDIVSPFLNPDISRLNPRTNAFQ
jgi:hypothetical protein